MMKMLVTFVSLFRMGACGEQVYRFYKQYPDGLYIPDGGQHRQEVLDEAARRGLHVAWWLRKAKQTGIARRWHGNGSLAEEIHYKDGAPHDPTDWTAAFCSWHANGVVKCKAFFFQGDFKDCGDGTAAVRFWNESGTLIKELHYTNGSRIENMYRDELWRCRVE